MTTRVIGADTFTLLYDGSLRMVAVQKNGATIAEFAYDGDGRMVVSAVGGTTTYTVGGYFELKLTASGSTAVKYYSAGGTRVAMRQGGVVTYLFGDHLGSTSVAFNDATNATQSQGYTAFGSERYSLGGELPTDYAYTGQKEFAEIGLHFYNARWYDGALGRFTQADTIIPQPGNPMDWDRFAYTLNNPMKFNDPTGHATVSVDCKFLSDGYCLPSPSHPTFRNSPVVLDGEGSIQYFGGTQFAQDQGHLWNYDGDCGGYHCGMDFGGEWGDSVYSSTTGTVKAIVQQTTGSPIIIIQYGDYYMEYWNAYPNVEVGQTVFAGTEIGKLRNHSNEITDKNTHVHLEIKSTSPNLPPNSIKDLRHNPLFFMTPALKAELTAWIDQYGSSPLTTFPEGGTPENQPKVIGKGIPDFWGR